MTDENSTPEKSSWLDRRIFELPAEIGLLPPDQIRIADDSVPTWRKVFKDAAHNAPWGALSAPLLILVEPGLAWLGILFAIPFAKIAIRFLKGKWKIVPGGLQLTKGKLEVSRDGSAVVTDDDTESETHTDVVVFGLVGLLVAAIPTTIHWGALMVMVGFWIPTGMAFSLAWVGFVLLNTLIAFVTMFILEWTMPHWWLFLAMLMRRGSGP